MTAYYNEIDPRAAAWLRELIAQGHIAPGHVDERSIREVRAADLVRYTQCHFFAGIGVWSAALRGAGWSDERPAWTGSCPCQPFSSAGRGEGFDDARHLWPEFYRLIAERRPPVIFGEQVASKDGLQWLDLVHADLEASGYAVGAVDLSAAGIGAPHVRQRLYWVADADDRRREEPRLSTQRWNGSHQSLSAGSGETRLILSTAAAGHWGHDARRLAHPAGARSALGLPEQGQRQEGSAGESDNGDGERPRSGIRSEDSSTPRHMGDPSRGGRGVGGDATLSRSGGHVDCAGDIDRVADTTSSGRRAGESDAESRRNELHAAGSGPTNEHWRDADWLLCRDGKWRAVEPGTFPLAHGAPARVGRLRGYGNAICLPLAQAFIEAYQEARDVTALDLAGASS